MKTITIGENVIQLDNEIKMKHLRKLMPIIGKMEDGAELEMIIEAAKIFFISLNGEIDVNKFEDCMDNFSLPETTKFSEEIGELISEATQTESKKKSKAS